ncbi:hypothetical protein AUP68_16637 [Ilyonectria robusta]
MSGAWITLSFVWDFANVQATLNVIISILGTIGIWTFSRLWYQRNTTKVMGRENTSLSSLFTVTSLGEFWDILCLLKHHVLQVQFIPLLFQGAVVIAVTVITILAGPIARFALRSVEVVRLRPVEGLLAYVPEVGPIGGMVSGNVLWNTTMMRLDAAGFPHDMLLDYLPSNDKTWVYQQGEWNSTWSVDCEMTNQTLLEVTADQNYTVSDPIRHFPALGATFNSDMFNQTEYRHASDFCGWTVTQVNGSVSMQDVYFFVLAQSNPSIHDRMYLNKDAMHLRLAVLHVHDAALVAQDAQFGGRGSWRVNGTIPEASYTSIECRIQHQVAVPDADVYVAWPWTNETDSIVRAYADYNRAGIMRQSDSASQVPDAKLDWMIHAFKNSKHVGEVDLAFPDRDLFRTAAYETVRAPVAVRGLARVYSNRPSDANRNQSRVDSKVDSQVDSQVDVPSVLTETKVSESRKNQPTEKQTPTPDAIVPGSLTTSPKDDATEIEEAA